MLQRRLALLVERKRLIAEGRGKGRHYRVPLTITGKGSLVAGSATVEARGEVYVPISPDAEAIKQAIRAPIQERQPVGYQRDFLDDYRPNETYYLPAETRQRLLEWAARPIASARSGQPTSGRFTIGCSSTCPGTPAAWKVTPIHCWRPSACWSWARPPRARMRREAQMILNHKAAIELLIDQADEIGFNRYTILNLHALLADNLLADPQAGGRLRRIPVGIDGTVYHPLEVPQLIDECFETILNTAAAIADPFEQAFFALVHLAYLQGFEDVNKRVSRLAANIPLIRGNLCAAVFRRRSGARLYRRRAGHLRAESHRATADVLVWAYERSSARYSAVRQSLGEPDPFRLRYRSLVAELVAAVVRAGMDKKAATALARQRATEQVPPADQARFVEVVETEIMSLHEGNIARYRLRPAEYHTWRQGWH